MAEWLGRALQKLPQRFESARDLLSKDYSNVILTCFYHVLHLRVDFEYQIPNLLFLTLPRLIQLNAILSEIVAALWGIKNTLGNGTEVIMKKQ
ncbi:MAG: hypothetical protein JWQ96_178 [Segetibacter sp.]|nr:hypothetical protein [Segetibacter sp.]